MPSFGENSLKHFATLHPDLQRVCEEAIKIVDFAIICGHRGEKDQEIAFKTKVSKLRWPKSRHNSLPSEAMDLTPYPCDWADTEAFFYLAGIIMGAAFRCGVKLTWLGQSAMRDLPHFELQK